jgi:TolB-like protein/class 3 adenylate cyclase
MSGHTKTPVALEIAHVLFIDIVGYSKLPTTEQHEAIAKLNELVQNTEPFQAAEKAERLLRIPAGDGMALVFYTTPEEPVRCAVAISRALKEFPNLQVRMGVHSGSVSGGVDVSGRANVAGAGINIAQRVMDCGDGGHILLSKHAADDLAEYEHWRPLLHDLGPCEVKHGLTIQVASLWNDEVGNSQTPSKVRAQRESSQRRKWMWLGGAAALLAMTTVFMLWHHWAKPAASVIDRSVAVLPFENLSTNEENAVFAGGVHREILLDLAKVSDLKVISRTSVMQYAAGAARNLKQIARELGVSHIVEGSVQRDRDKVRVTAQLIDAGRDITMWAKAYDGNLTDVFTIQNEIAQKITAELGATLSQQERTDLSTKLTQNVEAFDFYTKARLLMDTDPEDLAYDDNLTKAVQLLEAAVNRDRQFVAAYCALSEANTQLYRASRQKDCSASQAALSEARRIAPDAGETLFARALIEYYCDHDFNRPLATLELAARSLPNDSQISTLRGLLERRLGRWKESLRHFTDAIQLNPKDPTPYGYAAGGAALLRNYAESRRIMDAAIANFPGEADFWRGWKGWLTLVADADIAAARQQLKEMRTMNNKSCLELAFYVPYVERNYAEAEKALAALIDSKIPRIDIAGLKASFAVATSRAEEKREDWSALLKQAAKEFAEAPKGAENQLKGSAVLNAALSNKEEAIAWAKRGVELFPIDQDALIGPDMLNTLAVVYTWTGEKDLAFEILFKLAKMPCGGMHAGDLKLNPDWDNLRVDPRFNDLVELASQPLK